jgi:predicted Zn-dependent protease
LLCVALRVPSAAGDEIAEEGVRARATARRIELEWPIAPAGPVTRFIQALGARLGRAAGEAPFPWRFTVVRDRSANAFSIGGGRIYVNEGTAFVCRNEAEVAAILAHEMGHELAGHFRSAAGESSWLEGVFGSRRTRDEAIGSIRQTIDPHKELEADRISVEILRHAGYDPHAALSVAELLAERPDAHSGHQGGGGVERLRSLEDLIDGTPSGGRRDSETFRRLRRETEPGTE